MLSHYHTLSHRSMSMSNLSELRVIEWMRRSVHHSRQMVFLSIKERHLAMALRSAIGYQKSVCDHQLIKRITVPVIDGIREEQLARLDALLQRAARGRSDDYGNSWREERVTVWRGGLDENLL